MGRLPQREEGDTTRRPGSEAGERHPSATSGRPATRQSRAYLRPPGEDDDGYDPYSDRPPESEPLFGADPWR